MIRRLAAALATLALVFTTWASARAAIETQIVAGSRIAAVADRVAHTLVHGSDRAVAAAFQIPDQSVPEGNVSIAVAGSAQVNMSYASIPVTITVNGKVARTLYAGYRITSFMQTVVAAHDLVAGEVLTAADLAIGRVPFMGRTAVTIASVEGRKVRTAIARGSSIFPEQTAVNELVRAGMPAVLIVHDGSVALSADVVARTSGGIGEYVTVYNPATQRALSGVVTGPNIVELTLPGASQ